MPGGGHDLVAFAERVLALLDQGSFVATYKYAVLLALMDLCLEGTDRHGRAPDSITTRQLADKVIELYWPHTTAFRGRTLRQNAGRQAVILADIARFRAGLGDPSTPLDRARREAPRPFRRLQNLVEWRLILMPLPRLQVVGRQAVPLLYEIGWGLEIERQRPAIIRYQETGTGFDNRLLLYPGVGDHLVMLNGLLRPLVHRAWSGMVARLNDLDDSRLEGFLFGVDRTQLAAVRPGLLDLQHGQCFYCGENLRAAGAEVDHFIPWARYPDNGIENLVAADARCNGAKRDFLPAQEHLRRWKARNEASERVIAQIASDAQWESHASETLGVARGIYLRLAPGTPLWVGAQEFSPADPEGLRDAFA
jgi:5-methylcytosine-specific restriction endonuclease McrA